jgi:transposase
MQEIIERACGLDVHQKTVVACIMIGSEKKVKKEIKTFGTLTDDLRDLGQWIKENNIQDVAVESTGVYWIPVFNVLEGEFKLNIVLANAKHIKNVPGRKTDVKDCEWICKLLKNGLIEASFIPPSDIRHIRNLVRYRDSLVNNLTAAKNRVIKNLEMGNIKLSSILSDVFGVSGWKVIRAIVDGQFDSVELAKLIDKQVKAPRDIIKKALTGTLQMHHANIIKLMVRHIDELESLIKSIEKEIKDNTQKYEIQMQQLQTIPGVGEKVAASIVAEIGINMNQFHSPQHLASWAGLAPGNNESAGKKKSSAIREGNAHLKKKLVEGAWSAVKSKKTYWYSAYQRLKIRRGVKRALVAIAHKILICAYWIVKKGENYKELGVNYVDPNTQEKRAKYYAKQLEKIGIIGINDLINKQLQEQLMQAV